MTIPKPTIYGHRKPHSTPATARRRMAWFRLHESALDNPKVQKLPDRMFKHWINILCVASRYAGVLPSYSDIAFALRLSESDVSKIISALVSAKLIDKVGVKFRPHEWDKHQYKSDLSTERVKRFRKRHETVSRNAPEQSRAEQIVKAPKGPLPDDVKSRPSSARAALNAPAHDTATVLSALGASKRA